MSDTNSESPTVIGADANFKGELSFDKSVRIEGKFEGQISSKGTLHVAEGATVTANVEATNVKIEGNCKGNFSVSEKLHMMSTAKVEGDLRTSRLEIADGAIFVGNVVVGQSASQSGPRPISSSGSSSTSSSEGPTNPQPVNRMSDSSIQRPRPTEVRMGSNQ